LAVLVVEVVVQTLALQVLPHREHQIKVLQEATDLLHLPIVIPVEVVVLALWDLTLQLTVVETEVLVLHQALLVLLLVELAVVVVVQTLVVEQKLPVLEYQEAVVHPIVVAQVVVEQQTQVVVVHLEA
jgi:hypothetical protein